MQTGITVHDTDQTKENAMNTNLNHGESRKEKQMSASTDHQGQARTGGITFPLY